MKGGLGWIRGLTRARHELARLVMGTIFLVYLFIGVCVCKIVVSNLIYFIKYCLTVPKGAPFFPLNSKLRFNDKYVFLFTKLD